MGNDTVMIEGRTYTVSYARSKGWIDEEGNVLFQRASTKGVTTSADVSPLSDEALAAAAAADAGAVPPSDEEIEAAEVEVAEAQAPDEEAVAAEEVELDALASHDEEPQTKDDLGEWGLPTGTDPEVGGEA